MSGNRKTDEIYYDFDVHSDSNVSKTTDRDGKIILHWNKNSTKKVAVKGRQNERTKQHAKYEEESKAQLLWYLRDKEGSNSAFIGVININLNQLMSQKSKQKSKLYTQEIEVEIEKSEYWETSVKIQISAKKSLKIRREEYQAQEIQQSLSKRPETKEGTFYMISNDEIENFEEKYLSDDESADDDDEFFRGYSPAKEYKRNEDDSPGLDPRAQNLRNQFIMEDFTPNKNKPTQRQLKNFEHINESIEPDLNTPDGDYKHSSKQSRIRGEATLPADNNAGGRYDHKSIKMVDLDYIDESKIYDKADTYEDRNSSIKQLITLYGAEMNNKLSYKEAEELRESAKEETANLQTDKKRLLDQSKKYKKEVEVLRNKISELQTQIDRLLFQIKAKDSEMGIEVNKRDSEISQLKAQNKQLHEEIDQMFNYKSKCEELRNENLKMIDNEEQYEHQIEDLRKEIERYKSNRRNKSIEDSGYKDEIQKQITIYADKIKGLEQELKNERIDADQRAKNEIALIKESCDRYS